jgi:hypothetical protein
MFGKLKKGLAAFIGGLFVIAYIFLFFPALAYIPLTGALAFEMGIWYGIVCVLAVLTIPLSMPFAIYLIFSTYVKKSYLKMLVYSLLPGYFCIASLLLTALMMRLHCLLEDCPYFFRK